MMIFRGAGSAELHHLVEATQLKIIGAELVEDKGFQNYTHFEHKKCELVGNVLSLLLLAFTVSETDMFLLPPLFIFNNTVCKGNTAGASCLRG